MASSSGIIFRYLNGTNESCLIIVCHNLIKLKQLKFVSIDLFGNQWLVGHIGITFVTPIKEDTVGQSREDPQPTIEMNMIIL